MTAMNNKFDRKAIDKLRSDVGSETLQVLIDAFIKEITAYKEIVYTSYAKKDFTMIEIKAHAMKSAALSFGAPLLGEKCKIVEYAIKDNNTDNLLPMINNMCAEADETKEIFKDLT